MAGSGLVLARLARVYEYLDEQCFIQLARIGKLDARYTALVHARAIVRNAYREVSL